MLSAKAQIQISALPALLLFGSARAADICWTNALGGRWGDAVNWSLKQVPATNDNAFVVQPGSCSVSIHVNGVSNLVVGASGGTQTVEAATSPWTAHGVTIFATNTVLENNGLSAPGIDGPGRISMRGHMNRHGGVVELRLTVEPEGVLNIIGPSCSNPFSSAFWSPLNTGASST